MNRVTGNATLLQKLVMVLGALGCDLVGIVGHNNAAADLYIQIHETAAEPAAGAVPIFSVLANSGLPYSFALPDAVHLSACTIVASSTLDTYTASAGTPVTIQAIVR